MEDRLLTTNAPYTTPSLYFSIRRREERSKFQKRCYFCEICHLLCYKVLYNKGCNNVTPDKRSIHKCYFFSRSLSLYCYLSGIGLLIAGRQTDISSNKFLMEYYFNYISCFARLGLAQSGLILHSLLKTFRLTIRSIYTHESNKRVYDLQSIKSGKIKLYLSV